MTRLTVARVTMVCQSLDSYSLRWTEWTCARQQPSLRLPAEPAPVEAQTGQKHFPYGLFMPDVEAK
jgi:hypothetical protein